MTFAEQIVSLLLLGDMAGALKAAQDKVFQEALNDDQLNKKRHIAAKTFIAKKNKTPQFLTGVWYDDKGRQCFTNTQVAFRMVNTIDHLPQLEDGASHPDLNKVFVPPSGEPTILSREEVRRYIAHGKIYKDTFHTEEEAHESIGKGIIKVCGVYIWANLFSRALQTLGCDTVAVSPVKMGNGAEAIYISCIDGEAIQACIIMPDDFEEETGQ